MNDETVTEEIVESEVATTDIGESYAVGDNYILPIREKRIYEAGCGEVIIVKEGQYGGVGTNSYGAVHVDGNVIVENDHYGSYIAPNAEGYFALFGGGKGWSVFDKEGNEQILIEGRFSDTFYISEGCVTYETDVYDEAAQLGRTQINAYDLETGELWYQEIVPLSPMVDLCITAYQNGAFYYSDMESGKIYKVTREGTKTECATTNIKNQYVIKSGFDDGYAYLKATETLADDTFAFMNQETNEVVYGSFEEMLAICKPGETYYSHMTRECNFYDSGQVKYNDCSDFSNGYALVIDTDGMAYLINRNFEKITDGFKADIVARQGGIFIAKDGNNFITVVPPVE